MKNSAPQKKGFFRPPFDVFGTHPNFYLNGNNKTVTWVGCICTLMLLACVAIVCIMEAVSYAGRKNFELYTSEESLTEYPILDMSEKKFMIVLRSIYPEDKPYFG